MFTNKQYGLLVTFFNFMVHFRRTHEQISALPQVTFLLSFPLDVEFLPSSATGDVTAVSILVLEMN